MRVRRPHYRLAATGRFPFLLLERETHPVVVEWEQHERTQGRDGYGWYLEPSLYFWSFSFGGAPFFFLGRATVSDPLDGVDSWQQEYKGKPPLPAEPLGDRRFRAVLESHGSTHAGRAVLQVELVFDVARMHCHYTSRVVDVDIER